MVMRNALFLLLSLFVLVPAQRAGAAEAEWLDRLEPALEQARASGRYIFVDLFADWCGWCYQLAEEVFPSPAFQELAKDFILVRVDVMDGAQGTDLQTQYRVESLPTALVLDHKRVKIAAVSGFAEAERYVEMVRAELAKHQRLMATYEKEIRGSEYDARKLVALARELHERADGARAARVNEILLSLPGQAPAELAWARYRLADAYRMDRAFDQADRALAEARRAAVEVGNPVLVESIDLVAIYLAQDLGSCPRTKDALESFLKEHPGSSHRSMVSRTLRALRREGSECT